jgi:hypothetical protein
MRRPELLHLPLAVLIVTAIAARAIVGTHITDDAFITMRYSRNLSSAGELSYNPPDKVLGTSTPLWTGMLAIADRFGIAPERAAVGAATAADVTSIVLIMTSPAGGSLAALAAAATIAAWPAYVTYAMSGMETSLYVLTIVAFVVSLSSGRVASGAVAASMGALCRPDGALLVALGCGWTLLTGARAALPRFLGISVALCAPWLGYAAWRFGSFVPSSVTAKAAAADPWFLSFQNLHAFFLQGAYLLLTPLALAGLVTFAVRGGPLWRLWSLWGLGYLVGMTASNGFTHFPWYFVPLLPIFTAAAAAPLELGGWHLARKGGWHLPRGGGWHLSREGGWHRWREDCASGAESANSLWKSCAARTTAAAVVATVLLLRMPPLAAHLGAIAVGREQLYASVAGELAAIDGRCTVAATEIGTIGYFYPGRVLDLVGLVSPEVVGRPLDAVLTESDARWLVTYDTHFDRAVAASAPFAAAFERRSTRPVGPGRTLEIYERRGGAACGAP